MAVHKSKRLNEVIYFHFALCDASGNRKQGDPVTFVVRAAGTNTGAGIVYSASANLLSAAVFGSAAYECAISACADVTTGFSASGEYAVFVLASVSGITPIGMIGSFQLSPPPVNLVQVDGASAPDFPTSADVSAIAAGVLANYDVPTSADISAIVSVVTQNALNLANIATAGEVVSANAVSAAVINALTNYDVPTSSDVSAIVSALIETVGMSSASISTLLSGVLSAYNVASVGDITGGGVDYDQISAIVSARVQAAMVAYDVPTSADISAIVSAVVSGVLASYNVASADELAGGSGVTSAQVSTIVAQVLADQNIATAGEVVSANAVSAAVAQAMADYDIPTSADISAIVSAVVSGVLASYNVASAGEVVSANAASAAVANALANYDVPTSADVSAIVAGAMSNYDIPTSADISAVVSAVVVNVLGASQITALKNSLDAVLYGSAVTGTLSTTQMKYDLNRAMGANDRLIGRLLTFRGGNLDGEQTQITDLDVATSILTYTTITQSPGNGQAFTIS